MNVRLKPGESSPETRYYIIVNPEIGETPYLRYVPLGRTMPPTPGKGEWYVAQNGEVRIIYN